MSETQNADNKETKNKKSKPKKKTTTQKNKKTLFGIITGRGFRYIFCFVLGLVLLMLCFVSGAYMTVWNRLRSAYFGIFGLNSILLPFILIIYGALHTMKRYKTTLSRLFIEMLILFLLTGSLFFVNNACSPDISYGTSLGIVLHSLWMGSENFICSPYGLTGAVLGGALFALGKNAFLADILIILFILTDLFVMFRITPQKIAEKLDGPLNRFSEAGKTRLEENRELYRQRSEERATEREEQKKQRDLQKQKEVEESLQQQDADKKEAAKKPRRADSGKSTEEKSRRTDAAARTRALLEDFTEHEDADSSDSTDGYETVSAVGEKRPQYAQQTPDLYDLPVAESSEDFARHPRRTGTDTTDADRELNEILAVLQQNGAPEKTASSSAEGQADSPAVTVTAQEKAPEKPKPLSEKEENSFRSELNGALQTQTASDYELPPVSLLQQPTADKQVNNEFELKNNGEKLIAALASFNVQASILDVVPGPTVTRYEISPAPGVKISRIVGLSDDLALHLAAPSGLRIEAPIPNKAAIGVEIPNKARKTVTFREIIDTSSYRKTKSKLNVGLGKDISGNIICSDLAKMPHLLVAGTTGSGKSVCMNSMICSLLYNATPDEVKLLLIDPKQVEFSVYNGIPHLLVPVVSDPRKAAGALGWAVTEMLSRYKMLNANGVRDIGAYNSLCDETEGMKKMPQIVIFIDELSDLMTVAPGEVEDSIQRLAQMARAAGMHLVIATQRPSVDVITGVIKANIPSRIALSVSSQVDSRTIIDASGAEKLMGYGDMLYYPVGVPKPLRVQGCFLSDSEIESIVRFVKTQAESDYDDSVSDEIERQTVPEKKKTAQTAPGGAADEAYEELVCRAVELFLGTPEKASTSALQRHLSLGFAKAGRVMDTLEERGYIGPMEGGKPRKVLITKAQWMEIKAGSGKDDIVGEVSAENA